MDVTPFIDGIEANAKRNIKVNEGDYIGDGGLWYCGKCRTKKQTAVEILGVLRKPMCLCKCEIERKEAEEKERLEAEAKERLNRPGQKNVCRVYHLIMKGTQSKNVSDELKEILYSIADTANKFHRWEECGRIERPKKEEN